MPWRAWSDQAVIMETAAYLISHPESPHGPIRVCFTCDEEIGHGVDHLDLAKLGAQVAYTLDGGGQGEIDGETFSADLAVVTVRGINIHPAIGKGRMVNAVRLAGLLLDRLPRLCLSPETTADRDGFLRDGPRLGFDELHAAVGFLPSIRSDQDRRQDRRL